jgi:tetraacyldisaccharide 4'-kinase
MRMIADRLTAAWYRAESPPLWLRPAALLYRGLVRARRALYRYGIFGSTRLGVPVVVVGNLTVGGTGKTPLTLWLAEALAAHGRRPGVICRSYGAQAAAAQPVRPDDDPRLKGDEAVLLATRLSCPVWSGPSRARGAQAMLGAHPELDVIVCDDGLQHYALARDVEIAVIDGRRGFGNGWMLPAGPLREPPARLERVDAIVLNGENEAGLTGLPRGVPAFGMRLGGTLLRRVAQPRISAEPSAFADKRIAAVAGIGHPERFFDHLRSLGLVFTAHAFPDHHPYTLQEIRALDADCVLMTEKDAIKCARFPDERLWMLPVSAAVDAALLDAILSRIDERARSAQPPQPARKA